MQLPGAVARRSATGTLPVAERRATVGRPRRRTMDPLADTPAPPYYAVVFTSTRTAEDEEGYGAMAELMVRLAAEQPGCLGIESARGSDGVGITVSYWNSLEAIKHWREHAEHRLAQRQGRERWYERFHLRICRVERAYSFVRPGGP